jgi:hypothetical protein
MQKTQDRKRQREEDEEEEAEKGPAFSVNPDSLGKAAPPRRTLPSFENMWWTRSVVVPANPHLTSITLIPFLSSVLLLCRYLGAGMKTGKTSKIDRITHILEGRKDSKFEHDGHAGGLTNKEKLRKKNFVMVRKGKKSVNNKSRKAAGLDRHEKNTAASLYTLIFLLHRVTHVLKLHSIPTAPAVSLSVLHSVRAPQLLTYSVFVPLTQFSEGAIWPRQEEEKENIEVGKVDSGWSCLLNQIKKSVCRVVQSVNLQCIFFLSNPDVSCNWR